MDATPTKQVSLAALGITYHDITHISVMIRPDTGANTYPLNGISSGGTLNGGIEYVEDVGNVLRLQRVTSGTFDSTTFNSPSFNRGWVTIEYIK